MSVLSRVRFIPISQLDVPSANFLAGEFLYSVHPIPSPTHAQIIEVVGQRLNAIRLRADKRKYLTRNIARGLRSLVGDTPKIANCSNPRHVLVKIILVNGSSDQRSHNIGWYQSVCYNFGAPNLQPGQKKVAIHALTRPVDPLDVYTRPWLFAFIYHRELLRPVPRALPLLTAPFDPPPDPPTQPPFDPVPPATLPSMRPFPINTIRYPQTPSLGSPSQTHASASTTLLPAAVLTPTTTDTIAPPNRHARRSVKPRRSKLVPGVCPSASPPSPSGSDVVTELHDWNPFANASRLAPDTSPIRAHINPEFRFSPTRRLRLRRITTIEDSPTVSRSNAHHLSHHLENDSSIKAGRSKAELNGSEAINHILKSSEANAVLDLTQPQYKMYIDLTAESPKEIIDIATDDDMTIIEGHALSEKAVEIHFYLANGEVPKKIKLRVRESGYFCFADHSKILAKNNIKIEFEFWYRLRTPHINDPWVRWTWFEEMYIGEGFDDNDFLTFKHGGILTHHDDLAEMPFEMQLENFKIFTLGPLGLNNVANRNQSSKYLCLMARKETWRTKKNKLKQSLAISTFKKSNSNHSSVHHHGEEGHSIANIYPSQPKQTNILYPPLVAPLELPSQKLPKINDSNNDTSDEEASPESENKPCKKKTQTREVIDAFLSLEANLQDFILRDYDNPHEAFTCSCSRGKCLVQCRYDGCFQYQTSCRDCFIDRHRCNPFHWALIWDTSKRVWTQCDISELSSNYAIQLGHADRNQFSPCPNAEAFPFTITHTNGIHTTRLRFCGCLGMEDKVSQLMLAKLFPSTPKEPKSAFTFSVLKHFHMHNLQSKCGAYDFIHSLRRLTDNVFTMKVPDPYKGFLRVTRVWDILQLKRRTGYFFEISSFLSARPKPSLLVFCPACPEPGVNIPLDAKQIPYDLRHLVSIFLTMDGNHHANRYFKNSDRHDLSLANGLGYLPLIEKYKEYLSGTSEDKEKAVCNYIAAVNHQNRKKFRGMDETGLINVQCSHVLILSSVDMYLGERFAYSDYALANAFASRDLTGVPINVSYDSACSYSINIVDRFSKHLPQQEEDIRRTRFSIDSLHVNNHLDKCTYFFGACYQLCSAHFHGVGTEQYWSVNNQMGPQSRQMNPGHRHDKIIEHHSFWNWKKLTRIATVLVTEIFTAWSLYVEKRDYFFQLSEFHKEHIPIWYHLPKEPELVNGKITKSVYCHSILVKAFFSEFLNQDFSKLIDSPTGLSKAISTYFLKEGISIQSNQIVLKSMKAEHADHPLLASQQEISIATSNIIGRLDLWRSLQSQHMPKLGDRPSSEHERVPENERLFLPSDFSGAERILYSLIDLAREEAQLRQAQLYECLMQLRRVMKILSTMQKIRQKEFRGQEQNTRSCRRIQTIGLTRDRLLDIYNTSRKALVSLGVDNSILEDRFPPLGISDLYRKSTVGKRQLGDTYRTDGQVWVAGKSLGNSITPANSSELQDVEEAEPEIDLGKLWSPTIGLTDEELRQWEHEEDQVQWFRAWAEMQRWLEEFELKHVELRRTVQSFAVMSRVWAGIAAKAPSPGAAAFARKQASMYDDLHSDADVLLKEKGEKRFVNVADSDFVQAVQDFREQELGWLTELAGIGG